VLPVQPLALGVIVIVPLIIVLPALAAVKDGTTSDPLPAKPIFVLLFVQLYNVPVTLPVIVVAVVVAPVQ
jgi:hypothetical protein